MKKFISLVLSLIIILSVPTSVFAESTRPENSMPEIIVTGPSDIRSISMESGTTYLLKCDPDYTPAILPNVYMRADNEDKIILTLDDVIEIVSKELKVLKNGTTRFIAIKYDPKSKKTYVISQIAEKETNCHYLTATDILTKKTVISSSYSMQAEIDSGGEIVVTDAFTQTQYYYSTQTNRYKEAIGDITAGDKAMWIQDGYLCVGNLYWLALLFNCERKYIYYEFSYRQHQMGKEKCK